MNKSRTRKRSSTRKSYGGFGKLLADIKGFGQRMTKKMTDAVKQKPVSVTKPVSRPVSVTKPVSRPVSVTKPVTKPVSRQVSSSMMKGGKMIMRRRKSAKKHHRKKK